MMIDFSGGKNTIFSVTVLFAKPLFFHLRALISISLENKKEANVKSHGYLRTFMVPSFPLFMNI